MLNLVAHLQVHGVFPVVHDVLAKTSVDSQLGHEDVQS